MKGIGNWRPRQSNQTSGREGDPARTGNLETRPRPLPQKNKRKKNLDWSQRPWSTRSVGWAASTLLDENDLSPGQAQGQRGGNWSPDCLPRCCEGNGDNRVWGVQLEALLPPLRPFQLQCWPLT